MFGLRSITPPPRICLLVSHSHAQALNLSRSFPLRQFLDFAISIDPDLELYDPDAAWPSVMDDFVEHERSKRLGKDGDGGDGAMEE
jgi:hypothetical protein